MRTYRPNDLPGLNEFNKSDRNIYVDSRTNVDNIPLTVLQPPPITSDNHPSGSNNILRNNSFGGHRTHRYHWTYNSSANSGNLSPSGNIYFQLSQFYLSQFHSMIQSKLLLFSQVLIITIVYSCRHGNFNHHIHPLTSLWSLHFYQIS